MRFLTLSVLLAGCGYYPDAPWETVCGMRYVGGEGPYAPVKDFTQENVQQIESWAIEAGLVSCKKIKGIALVVHANGPWTIYPETFMRSGATYCNTMFPRIEIAAPFFSDKSNAIAHELHHIEQGCNLIAPVDEGLDGYHGDWDRSGAFRSIWEIDSKIIAWGESRNVGGE